MKYLIDQKLASKIRVADKAIPDTAFVSDYYLEYFKHPSVERVQCNLANETSAQKAFKGEHFDYIINLAAETKYGQDDKVYEEHILTLATNVGRLASDHKPEKFIQFSTAQVYEPSSKAAKENAKIKPWTRLAFYHKQAEEALEKMDLPLVIVRPAVVYGPCDMSGLSMLSFLSMFDLFSSYSFHTHTNTHQTHILLIQHLDSSLLLSTRNLMKK